VDNPVVSQAVNNKPVISEVQKEVPSLEVKTFSERSNAPVSPGQEAFLPTESISSPWVINIASFSSKRYAINLLDKIKKDGFNVYITKFKQKDKLWYRVRIGFFPTREYASIVGKDLSERYVLQGLWIANVSRYEALKYKEIE
jgi:cell division septation protein DedD